VQHFIVSTKKNLSEEILSIFTHLKKDGIEEGKERERERET
jgi:hypothetical protein